MLIETRVEVDLDKVWEAVWGNDGQGFAYWVSAVRARDGADFHAHKNTDKDVSEWLPNPHDFKIYDSIEETWHEVSTYALAKAWVDARHAGLTHCGGCSLDDPDACTEDIFLQYAVFGDVIYG